MSAQQDGNLSGPQPPAPVRQRPSEIYTALGGSPRAQHRHTFTPTTYRSPRLSRYEEDNVTPADPADPEKGLQHLSASTTKTQWSLDMSEVARAERYEETAKDVLRSARKHIVYPVPSKDHAAKTSKLVTNVPAMHAYCLRLCQAQLVEAAAQMTKSGRCYRNSGLMDLIHRYCDALRDMDYMHSKAAIGIEGDPFQITTNHRHERQMMDRFGLLSDAEKGSLDAPVDPKAAILPGLGENARLHAEKAKCRYLGLLAALSGGLALVVPMIIMQLVPGRNCALVTTSIFVLAFALVIALFSELRPGGVLAVTASYAAVLVVFVGTSTRV